MALACGVRTSVTSDLNSSIMASVMSPPFSLARDFCREPRWSIAAAAITPRLSDTRCNPASFPGVSFISPPISAVEWIAGQKKGTANYCNTLGGVSGGTNPAATNFGTYLLQQGFDVAASANHMKDQHILLAFDSIENDVLSDGEATQITPEIVIAA